MVRIAQREFGTLSDGGTVNLFTMSNSEMSVSVTDFGCILTSLFLPSKSGKVDDILLGFSTLDGYAERNRPHFGSLIGRYANRMKNAQFTLDGTCYQLDKNFGEHSLHGGRMGFDRVVWHSEIVAVNGAGGIRFWRTSPDGEQGYPGNLELEVLYLLNDNNELTLQYSGSTDAPTPINLTNHAYFNLKGHGAGSVEQHIAQVKSDKRLEAGEFNIPTGRILPVAGTAFDFNTPKPFGKALGSAELAATNGGYDACYCFAQSAEKTPLRAIVSENETGRSVHLSTNQPCMQLYTAGNLQPTLGKNGSAYDKMGAFCLETAQYTNAPNIPDFPQSTLHPGETYESISVYRFAVS